MHRFKILAILLIFIVLLTGCNNKKETIKTLNNMSNEFFDIQKETSKELKELYELNSLKTLNDTKELLTYLNNDINNKRLERMSTLITDYRNEVKDKKIDHLEVEAHLFLMQSNYNDFITLKEADNNFDIMDQREKLTINATIMAFISTSNE